MIDSPTQTQAISIIGDWLGNVLGGTARRVFADHAAGPHEPTNFLTLSYTGDYGWSYPDWIANSGIVAKMAEIGLTIAPADGAIDAVVITEAPAKQYVYVLTAELEDTNETGDYDGITTVHATQEGALAQFNEWLDRNFLDRGAAHYGEVSTETFLGGDPDPDTFANGETIHWGINKTEVRA